MISFFNLWLFWDMAILLHTLITPVAISYANKARGQIEIESRGVDKSVSGCLEIQDYLHSS
jgi:hypothetical protein